MNPFEIRKLSINTRDDFLQFFDHIAFTDNPDWAGCYCCFFHFGGTEDEWLKRNREENRQAAIDFIRSGQLQGFLAYANNQPVGWCNVNRKQNYPWFKYHPELNSADDAHSAHVVSIVCFLIAPDYRKQGIAHHLLSHVVDSCSDKSCQFLEAYPYRFARNAAEHYRGPVSLYQNQGFDEHRVTNEFIIMRKKLNSEY